MGDGLDVGILVPCVEMLFIGFFGDGFEEGFPVEFFVFGEAAIAGVGVSGERA